MRECKEKPTGKYGHYCCGGGVTINGVRYCTKHAMKMQIDYAGHLFCACLGEERDEDQMQIHFESEGADDV